MQNKNTLHILTGSRGYYWHCKSPNGKILYGSAGDGFKRLAGLKNNLRQSIQMHPGYIDRAMAVGVCEIRAGVNGIKKIVFHKK